MGVGGGGGGKPNKAKKQRDKGSKGPRGQRFIVNRAEETENPRKGGYGSGELKWA